MIELCNPGRGNFRLAHLTLDLNGTLTLDGRLIDGVADRLRVLCEQLDVHPDVLAALDLLLNAKRLVATLRR